METKSVSCFEATSFGVWAWSFIVGLRAVDFIQRLLRLFCDHIVANNDKSGSQVSISV